MIHTISLPQLSLQSLTLNFDVALLSPASLEQQKAFGRLCQDPGAATRCSSLLLGLQHPFCQASFPVPLHFLHHQNSLGCTLDVPASSCHPHGALGGIFGPGQAPRWVCVMELEAPGPRGPRSVPQAVFCYGGNTTYIGLGVHRFLCTLSDEVKRMWRSSALQCNKNIII